MLLRSSSSPIPSSCLPQYHNSRDYPSPESDPTLRIPRTSSFSLTTSKNRVPHGISRRNSKKSTSSKIEESDHEVEEGPVQKSFIELFSSSGLDKTVGKHEESSAMEGGIGSNGWGGGHGSRWDQSSNEEDGTDSYYQKMIQANPNNPLFLANYAKFLKEVVGDYVKAEEYLERAILANPDDGNILCVYADLIWETQKNADRAEGYYGQAIKTAPSDCYVLASYAKFLWDAEEEEVKEWQHESDYRNTYQSEFFQESKNVATLL